MRPERVALGLLALIALVMSVNYVSATGRFLDANRAYDGLGLSLDEFSYTGVESPVRVRLTVANPSDSDVDILALRISLRAGLQLVGGGEIYVNDVLAAGESRSYQVDAEIDDKNVVSRIESEGINWLLRGEIQVQLDERVEPVWIQFSVRTITE